MSKPTARRTRATLVALIAALALHLVPGASASAAPAGRYIVVLRASVARAADVARAHGALGARPGVVYEHAIKGYAATLPVGLVSVLRADPRVALVEPDLPVRALATQTGPPWGLDRIDQRRLPLSQTFTYSSTGRGVTAYVIDTGVRVTHADFRSGTGSRAVSGYDAVDGGAASDCNGHGTHVAGTIGGTTYGVAKGVRVVAVRVLDCLGYGSTSDVIAGVDWVTRDHQAGSPAVANMSLGGGASSSLDRAVRNSIADGVSYAVAAGNGNILGLAEDACWTSPARVGQAMTISATDRNDHKASWANYGSCVDWFAPGVSIPSAWWTSDTATSTISGTSMAAPHTAGVAALYLQADPSATPAEVRNALYGMTTRGVVSSSRTANNHLLYTNL